MMMIIARNSPTAGAGRSRSQLLLAAAACLSSLALLFVAAAAVFDLERPRLRVRWSPAAGESARESAEKEYGLIDRRPVEDNAPGSAVTTWSYVVANMSPALAARMSRDARMAAVGPIDPEHGWESPGGSRLRWRPPNEWSDGWQPQSAIALAAAILLMAVSIIRPSRWRRRAAIACVLAFAVAALTNPIAAKIRMGDSETYTRSRGNFESYFVSQSVRFEAHLSGMVLRAIYKAQGADGSPIRTFSTLASLATIAFGGMLLVAGWAGRWSPATVRYLALVVACPATLMYFGYRELGYLALNPAAFPLLIQGIRGWRRRYEAGCVASGLGAALHGFGLLSLAGAALMTSVARLRLRTRLDLVTRAFAFGSTTYLIWVFVYVAGLHLQVIPGHAEDVPWRPLFENRLAVGRLNMALFSMDSAFELAVAGCIAGAMLFLPAVASIKVRPRATVMALAFSAPALAFFIRFWPIQGLAVESDLIFAAFPAIFALAWLASQSRTLTIWALLLLVSGHVAFWRTVTTAVFVSSRIY